MSEQEVIKRLSELHKEGLTDPESLWTTPYDYFDREKISDEEIMGLQLRLYNICYERGEDWTLAL